MRTREQIRDIVVKNMIETVEGLDASAIDTGRSMKELGASSLDIVEVVSCSMRELRVKVPRAELGKLKNVDELVDLLARVVAAVPATTSGASAPQA